jgi:hypothetical protein
MQSPHASRIKSAIPVAISYKDVKKITAARRLIYKALSEAVGQKN